MCLERRRRKTTAAGNENRTEKCVAEWEENTNIEGVVYDEKRRGATKAKVYVAAQRDTNQHES